MACGPAASGASDGVALAGEPHAPWRIVLLRSWDSLYPINAQRENALREAIADNAPRVVEFFPEEIDTLRFKGDIERDLVALLQRKYRDTAVDLVIASGNEPLDFVTRHRDAIWPRASTVFYGVYEDSLGDWQRPARTTGLTTRLDVAGTVALGRALVPGARSLHVVSGAADFDRFLLGLVAPKLASLQPPIEVHTVAGLSRAQTVERVAALGDGALVLYLSMLRDSDGALSGPAAPAMAQVAARSSAPVLSVSHPQFRRGPVGGSAPRIDQHGREAGLLARHVLHGADASRIAVRAAPTPICEVDWNALQRWRIPDANVPGHCRIANQPPSMSHTYVWPLVALLVIVLAQAALIRSLVVQRRRRRLAEAELQARAAEMVRAARLSMVGALTASIAHEINQSMGAILSNAEAAEMMLEQGTLDSDKLREILADIRGADLRATEVIRSLRKLLARNEWSPVALDLNTEVAEALRHVAVDAARHEMLLSPHFGRDLPAIHGVAVQVQQVVINLAMNAMEAVRDAPGSRREIRIQTVARNEGAEVIVSDNGPGLPAEEAERLFDSLFTTRKDGMGFGLAIVRSIVDKHNGRLWYEPNVPRGASFHVWLPAIGA